MNGTQDMAIQDKKMRETGAKALAACEAVDERDGECESGRENSRHETLLGRFRRRIDRGLDGAARAFRLGQRTSERVWEGLEAEIRARALCRAARHHLSAEDAEDVASESCLRLYGLLSAPEAERIGRLDGYVHRIIDNLCKEQIRREKPVWSHLRGDIVETLRGKRAAQGFALWRHGGVDLAGFALWSGGSTRWTERYTEVQHDIQPLRRFLYDRGVPLSAASYDLPGLLAAVLDWLTTPIPVNELTSLCFDVLGLCERRDIPTDEAVEAAGAEDGTEERLFRGLLLSEVARSFVRLPRPECAAFLFHLQPDVAEQMLLALVPDGEGGTALEEMAARLQMDPCSLELTLEEIPWSDLRIAAFLGVREASDRATQLFVINRRQRAMRVMRRTIERAELV